MRKAITILGTLIITSIILISGSVVATFVYGESVYASDQASNVDNILGAPNPYDATLGENSPSEVNGAIVVELNSSDAMPADQQFTVYAGGTFLNESYNVSVSENGEDDVIYIGDGDDQSDYVFTTPSWGSSWRYIHLTGATGSRHALDDIYGPEIDAVGWDKP
jgi:hypothetical protein